MVSIKRYLNRGNEDAGLWQAVSHLLERIGSVAVIADEGECAAFRQNIDQLRSCVGEDCTPVNALSAAESAAHVMEAYNKEITALLRKQRHELKDFVAMIAETVTAIAGENSRSVEKLREIGEALERANTITDHDTLKMHLSECLLALRQETLCQLEQTQDAIIALRKEIEHGPQLAATPDIDAATSLLLRDSCVKAMHAAIPAGQRRYVVTLIVNRVQTINAKFGYEVGDRVLCRFGEFIEQQLLPEDRLFRWRGPALVALLERSHGLDQVRLQIKRMMEHRLEESFELEGREVLIPISSAWSVFQLQTTVASAETQIEKFAASQASREYI